MGFEIGVVISKKTGYVKVKLAKQTSCGTCHCCALGSEDKYMIADAVDELGAEVGQQVKVEIEELSQIKYGFIVYIAPLLMFLVGYLIGEYVAKSFSMSADGIQGISLLAGFLCFALPFLFLYFFSKRKRDDKKWLMRVVEIHPQE